VSEPMCLQRNASRTLRLQQHFPAMPLIWPALTSLRAWSPASHSHAPSIPFADLVAVEGDPLADINVAINNVRWGHESRRRGGGE